MNDWGFAVLWVLGVGVGWVYIVAPLMLVLLVRQPGEYEFRRVEADEEGLPPEVVAYWEEAGEGLERLGFREAARLATEAKQRGYLRIFEHAGSGDVANAMVVITPVKGKPPIIVRAVEFCTEYEHGLEIETTTTVDAKLTPQPAERVVLAFAGERDVALLYRAHQAALRRYGGGRKRALPGGGGWEAELQRSTRRSVSRFIDSGWFVMRRDGTLRPTVLGAMMMGWRNLPPMLQIRRRLSGRREREILRAVEAGVG